MGKEKEKDKKEKPKMQKQRSKSFMIAPKSDKHNEELKKEGSISPRYSRNQNGGNWHVSPNSNNNLSNNNNNNNSNTQKPEKLSKVIEDLSVVFPKHQVEEKKKLEGNVADKLKSLRNQEKIYLQGWLWREEQTREKWSKRWVVLTNHRLIFLKAPPSTVALNETLPELALKVINVLKHGTKDGENRKPDTFILETDSGLEVVLAACISDEEYEQNKKNNSLLSIFDEKQSRNEWWAILKDLISKSKLQYVYLKEEGRNILKEAAKKNMDCIQTLHTIAKQAENSKRDEGFKKQAQNLSLQYTNLIQQLEPLRELDGDLAKATERNFIALNEAAVAVAALCPNKKARDLILSDMVSIAKETAAILHRSTDAHVNPQSKEEIFKGKSRLNELVLDAQSFLNEISDFITDIDDSLANVELQIVAPNNNNKRGTLSADLVSQTPPSPVIPPHSPGPNANQQRFLGNQRNKETPVRSDLDEKESERNRMEEEKRGPRKLEVKEEKILRSLSPEEKLDHYKNDIDLLQTTAKDLANAINIVHTIPQTPKDVKAISKDISNLMVQLLDATHVIAEKNGLGDEKEKEEFNAALDDQSEYRRHHLQSLLAAAKGFSAATANFVDLFKQIPLSDPKRQSRPILRNNNDKNYEADESFKLKFDQASNNSEFALNAFLDVCKNIQFDNEAQAIRFKSPPSLPSPQSILVEEISLQSPQAAKVVNNGEDLNALLQLNLAQKNLSSTLANLLSTIQSSNNNNPPQLSPSRDNINKNKNNSNENVTEFMQKFSKITGDITENTIELFKEAEKSQIGITKNDKDYYKKDPTASLSMVSSIQDVNNAISQLNDLLIQSKVNNNINDGEEAKMTTESIIAALHMIKSSVARFHVNNNLKSSPSPAVENLVKEINVKSNQLIHSAKDHLSSLLQQSGDDKKNYYETLKSQSRPTQIRAEFEAQAKIAELESLLDIARQNLFLIRRSIYGNRS